MKHMKDYYRYFYEDKVPLSPATLKRYDKYPVPKRRQCELYLNSIKYNGASEASRVNFNINANANPANPGEFQERIRNLPLGFQQQQDFVIKEQQQPSPDLVVPSFTSTGSGFEIRSNVSLPLKVQSPISFEDERELLHSYSDKRNNNVNVNSDNDEVDITVKCGDQPMDLTVPYPAYTDGQAGIFENLPPDLEAPRSETPGRGGEEVLDLSMKTSKPSVKDADHPEFYNVHDLSQRASFLERNFTTQRVEADPENGSEFSANKKWSWFGPDISSSSSPFSNNDQGEHGGQSPLLANRNSILYKILNEESERRGSLAHLARLIPSLTTQGPPAPPPPPPGTHPAFPPRADFAYPRHKLGYRSVQHKPPSPDGLRYVPLSPGNSSSSSSGGPHTPPSPQSPGNSTPPHQYPLSGYCGTRTKNGRRPAPYNRPSLSSSILKEMGIQAYQVQPNCSNNNNMLGNLNPTPSENNSDSSVSKSEKLADVMKVQNVYVNYLRQLLKNIEDCKTSLSDTAESSTKSSGQSKDFASSSSSEKQGQFAESATCTENCSDLSDKEKQEGTTCQNVLPIDKEIKSEPVSEDDRKGDSDVCESIPSDIMAILQAQVLQKSLSEKDCKDSKDVNEGATETVRNSSLSFIHSLIEDEFKELNCD